MSLGWFTLGATGDIKLTNINVNEGIFYVDKVSKRVGINVRESPDPIPLGTDPLIPFQPLSQVQIGKPDITTTIPAKFQINTDKEGQPFVPSTFFAEQANVRSITNTLIFSDESYRPTSGNATGMGDTAGFTKSFDSTIWVASKGSPVQNFGTGIAFGGLGKNGKYVPYARISGVSAAGGQNEGELVIEVLKEIVADDGLHSSLLNKPMLFERLRIKSDGKIGLGVYEPEYDFEMSGGFKSFGLVNYGYEIHSATEYSASGSTIFSTETNSLNIFSSARESESWYYNLENLGNIDFIDNYSGTSHDVEWNVTMLGFTITAPTLGTVTGPNPDGFSGISGTWTFTGYIVNDSPYTVDVTLVNQLNVQRGVLLTNMQPFSSSFRLGGFVDIQAGDQIFIKFSVPAAYVGNTKVSLTLSSLNSTLLKGAKFDAVTTDPNGFIYAAGTIKIFGDSTYEAKLYKEETLEISPNFEPTVTTSTVENVSVLTKIARDGTVQWVAKIDGARNEYGVSVVAVRNRTASSSADKYDVYVAGVSTSASITAYAGIIGGTGSGALWSATGSLSYTFANTVARQRVFVIRYESVYSGSTELRMEPKDICSFENSTYGTYYDDVYLLGMDIAYPESFDNATLFDNTEIFVGMTCYASTPGFFNTIIGTNNPLSSLPGETTFTVGGYIVTLANITSSPSVNPTNYLYGIDAYYRINTRLTDIGVFGFQPSGVISLASADTFTGREGLVRRDFAGNYYMAFPVSPGTLLTSFGDSISITNAGSLIFVKTPSNPYPVFIQLLETVSTDGVTITSIDVDKGRTGTGPQPSIYVAGFTTGPIQIKYPNSTGSSYTTLGNTRDAQDSGAFVSKFGYTPGVGETYEPFKLSWFAMVDGPAGEYGVSIAVDKELLPDQDGRYNVYLSGSFRSTQINVFNANPGLNPADTESTPSKVLRLSEVGIQGHNESFVFKFNYLGKYMFNFKAGGNGDVIPLCIDVGVGDNLALVGYCETDFLRLTEPDGTVSRYFRKRTSRSGLRYPAGFIMKYRTSNTLLLESELNSDQFKKTILNNSTLPLYVCLFQKIIGTTTSVFTGIATIPGRSSMVFINNGSEWLPDTSNKLSSDILSIDKDNARIGFGTQLPLFTMDVRGDGNVSGNFGIGRDVTIGGRINVQDSRTSVYEAADFPFKINGEPIFHRGMVMMWSGIISDIPPGWLLCDGTNGTPNLSGRFVLGYKAFSTGPMINSDATYGVNTVTGSSFSSGSTGGEYIHTLSITEMPAHTHQAFPSFNAGSTPSTYIQPALSGSDTQGFTGSTGGSAPHNNMPPYYVLAYIMKT